MNVLEFAATARRQGLAAPQHDLAPRRLVPSGWVYLAASLVSGPLWWGVISLVLRQV